MILWNEFNVFFHIEKVIAIITSFNAGSCLPRRSLWGEPELAL